MTDDTIAGWRVARSVRELGVTARLPAWRLPLAAVLAGTGLIVIHAARFGSWIADDAGITFAYARSLSDGYGPVLQPGAQPVEGFSNPAWLGLLTIGRLGGLFDRGTIAGIPDYALFPKAVALLLMGGILMAFHVAGCKVVRRAALATLLAAGILAAIPSFVIWCFSGLENSLFAFAVVWLAVILFGAACDDRLFSARVAVLSGALVALAALTRPDGLIYAATYPIVALIGLRRPMLAAAVRHVLLHVVIFAMPCGAYLVWRYVTFGRLIPNTAVAKNQKLPTVENLHRIDELLDYVGAGPVLVLTVLLGVVLARRSPLRRGLAALLVPLALAALAFVILGKDWMDELRFATPIWPLGALIATLALFQTLSGVHPRVGIAASIAIVIAIVPTGLMFLSASNEFRARPTYPMCVVADRYGRSFNAYADILGVREGSLLLPDLGGSAMTSRLRLVDVAGLAEPRIAEFQRDNDPAALRDYVFDVVRPTFIHSFGPWSASLEISRDPRLARDYVAIYTYPGSPYEGDWVRKEAVPSVQSLQAAHSFAVTVMSRVTSERWAAPLDQCGSALRVGQTPLLSG